MSSHSDDRTSRAIIRDEALALFSAHGADAVTIRQIAAAAEVSPALIIRHYGSKNGLREAVDVHVLKTIATMMDEMTQSTGLPIASQVEALRHLPTDSPIPRYLARLFVEGGATAGTLFHRILDISQAALENMVEEGTAAPGADIRTRAAFLGINDLAVLLFRDLLTDWLGIDPISRPGLEQWCTEACSIYEGGLRAKPLD